MNNELELGAAGKVRPPVTLQSATGIGSPVTVEVREDVGVVWLTSYAPLETCRAWANPKLSDLLDALGDAALPHIERAVIQRLIEKAHAQYHHRYAEWLRAELDKLDK